MKKLVLLGIVILLVLLVVTFPARLAYNWFAPADLTLSGISGSVWNGAADEGVAGGAYVRDIAWRFQPLSLLSGEVRFTTRSSPLSGDIATDVSVGAGGALVFSGLSGSVPLDMVHAAFREAGIRGDIALEFDSLTIKDGVPVAAEGAVTVSDFFAPDLSLSRIGDFRAEFTATGGDLTGIVTELSGILEVDGTITVSADRSYSFIGEVGATRDAPQAVHNQLRFLGSPNERGRHLFRFEGRL